MANFKHAGIKKPRLNGAVNGLCRIISAFGNNDHGFPQNTVVQHIAGLQFGNDCAVGFFFVFDFLNDLMKVRIKNGVHNFHFFDAEFVKDFGEFVFGQFNTFTQRFAVFGIVFADGVDGAVQIVGNGQ